MLFCVSSLRSNPGQPRAISVSHDGVGYTTLEVGLSGGCYYRSRTSYVKALEGASEAITDFLWVGAPLHIEAGNDRLALTCLAHREYAVCAGKTGRLRRIMVSRSYRSALSEMTLRLAQKLRRGTPLYVTIGGAA